jgi:hypothetical protein
MAVQETIDAHDERRFDHGAWLTLAVAVVLLFGMLLTTLLGFQYPTDGWTNSQQESGAYRVDDNVAREPSPLQQGDLILAINGQPLSPDRLPPLPPNLHTGQELRYTIQRDDQTMDVAVRLVRRSPFDLLAFAAGYISADLSTTVVPYISLAIAAVVFALRPGSTAARYLLIIFAFYSSSVFSFADYHLYRWSYPLLLGLIYELAAAGWAWIFFPSWALFALASPVRKWPLRRFPRLLPALLYGVPFVLSVLLATLKMITGSLQWDTIAPVLVWMPALLIAVLAVFGSLIHNFITLRDSTARAQLRWLAFGLGIGWGVPIVGILLIAATGAVFEGTILLWSTALFPLAVAIAITRYRLFDIDIIIRRTLVYSVLTFTLGLVYLGCILVSRTFIAPLTGTSELAIVVSTLAIAALFMPLRRRIQNFIDRRFYRRKYDAAKVLAAFGATAREETDLARLTAELVRVVDETIQPEFLGLWLRDPQEGSTTEAA